MSRTPDMTKTPRNCVDCGDEYMVCKYISSVRKPRCKRCQDLRNEESYQRRLEDHRIANAEKMSCGHEAHRKDKVWKIIADPDESWGLYTQLGNEDIRMLVRDRFLVPGVTFRHIRTGDLAIVRKAGLGIYLERRKEAAQPG